MGHYSSKDEIFVPLLPIVTYETAEQAMDIVRALPDPLAQRKAILRSPTFIDPAIKYPPFKVKMNG
jgi:hypothetical protein